MAFPRGGTRTDHELQIVATLGPASADPATWLAMAAAGATAFRLNTSHMSPDEIDAWLQRLRACAGGGEPPLPVVLDLQGSKWRLGQFAPAMLDEGARVELVHADTSSRPGVYPVPHADFFEAAPASGGEIVLNDAKLLLAVVSADGASIRARVVRGGPIAPAKGITLTGCASRRERLTDKDRAIAERTRALPGVRYAVSYVRDAAEMAVYRAQLGAGAHLAAKLERATAITDAAAIAGHCDELWLCRGDLGAELGLAGMARASHEIARKAARLPKPMLLAGQVLEHMTAAPEPTRSEVCCMHDALTAGFAGFVLSDETAIGLHPVEASAPPPCSSPDLGTQNQGVQGYDRIME